MNIEISEEAGVRYLHFGSDWVQGAMRVARPWSLELEYTREMMACLLLRPESEWPGWPKRVLLIGLGAASLTKFLHRQRPSAKLTVVEIAPAVVAVARQHFKLPAEDERLRIVVGDGADYVMKDGRPFDLILVDGFDARARAGVLDTLPFYLNCRARLSERGLLVCNLLNHRKSYQTSLALLREAFDQRALAFPSCDSGNIIAFAARGEPVRQSLEELRASAQALKTATGLNLLPTLTRLEKSSTCGGGVLSL
ncbi:spermidine synthase [Denitratisoma sp. DHT3]|uniref:fused MFS/spermidine synthase n=1 Tax=Denitratisoma sp. DHT3 TaxID=1981880 RepID=UPI0011983521|nr:fused MFS/spermidine synthase [Denitratisoma sp. DHT3]QDX80642.1 spermidine synthase [Denitratisoma sp. DHT3]